MNFLFCITLNLRNGSVSDYVDREKPLANNYIFCILVGLIAYSEFLFFGMGETQMGRFSVLASYPIHMAFIIAFSNMWGILLHEHSYQNTARAGSVIVAWFDDSLRIWKLSTHDSQLKPPGMIPPAIIDTHQHLWNLSQFELGWLKEEPFCQLNRDYTLEDYGRDTSELNVIQSIYMEVDVLESQQPREAKWILDLCQWTDNRVAAAVISGRPGPEGFTEYVERFRQSPFLKGVCDNLYGKPKGYCSQKDFVADIRILGEVRLSFDIETPTEGLSDAARLIDTCPETQFILDHCGNPMIRTGNLTTWQANVAAVAHRKNVVVKISGFFTWVAPERWSIEDIAPVINHLWEHSGPDHVMFGSDWPVVTIVAPYRRWVEVVSEAASNRDEEIQRKLFHDNAIRVYGLTNLS